MQSAAALGAPATPRMGALSKTPHGRAAQREMPLEGSLSPHQLPPPQPAWKYQYCCQLGFGLGTPQCLQPTGGGRGSAGWRRWSGCWKGAGIRQWDRVGSCKTAVSTPVALPRVALGEAPRHVVHCLSPITRARERAGVLTPGRVGGQGSPAHAACIPQGCPLPTHLTT